MYIHWLHYYIPKLFGGLSFICNPILMYLVLTKKELTIIGKYRYLLFCFAVFDMIYSAVELVVPMAIHGSGAVFVVYIAGGPFFENLEYGQLALSIRCGFISLSYGILVIHFIYRYLVLCQLPFVYKMHKSRWIVGAFVFFVLHGVVWSLICQVFLYADEEVRNYIRDDFIKTYGVDPLNIPMLVAMYHDGSFRTCFRSWTGIILLTCISIYAISLYLILGFRIWINLRSKHKNVSPHVLKINQQLFKALIVQTAIPICISFAPCVVAWYTPAVGLNLEKWNNFVGVIALSAFPTLDPLAIIFLISDFRKRLFSWFFRRRNSNVSPALEPQNRIFRGDCYSVCFIIST